LLPRVLLHILPRICRVFAAYFPRICRVFAIN
jgi:hypothetical protein